MIFYKGIDIKDEINKSNKILDKIGFINASSNEYILSDNKTKHQIIVYKKIRESKISLPRRVGMAQKKPLI